ncbi:L,D-transpeptidase family protein [Hyphomicrobium sp.]|uniref:L,D-transpeptidase family protein n=3 Tax=Hyphomicrobium sp. TaxID=82 RepID=UPI001328265A|nr:L,D-transpeptidase family protein [Hyphomicrobium sp.]KAB2939766.1 MAG: L,D-transpeptidase family protein [Hyphomicrobium sp.]
MLGWRQVALGMASSLIFVAAAEAQQPGAPRIATAEPLPATAPAITPAPAPQDPIGIALQQKLAPAKARADDQDAQDRAALAGFYATRVYAPIWVFKTGLNDKAADVITEFGKAADWGLEPADFAIPSLAPVPGASEPSPEALAEAELTLSLSVLRYARYARGGRIMDPATQLSSYLDRKPQLLEPKDVIEKIAAADAADAHLRGLHPKHPEFEKLRQKMLELRQAKAAPEVIKLPPGRVLSPGKSDPQVALLRQRLKVALPVGADPNFYDEPLKAAVIAYQTEVGTRPDGYVGNATRALLNDVEELSPQKLIANMEEWRWMPEDLGDLYVTVNIPEFTLRIVKGGAVVHTERVITGLPDKQTPVFSETMKSVAFQPRWNVPNSIKVNELWPSLARGGTYFRRQGLRVSKNGRDIDPDSIDWAYTDIRNYDVYQPPGAGNVLGELKFNFPNKHAVYMHDTNAKGLFEETSRTFSHGCMRVRNPRRMAEVLLSEDKGWDEARIADVIANGPPNNEVQIDRKIGVHITYFTAWVDDKGELQTARDVYGHEQRIQLALAGRWTQIAKGPNHLAPVRAPEGVTYAGGNPFKSVGDFISSALGGF